MPVMLDLFSGLCGASSAFRDAGWTVYTADINPEFNPDFCVDLANWSFPFELSVDLVWASPPCTYFSRYIQRGVFKNEPLPDMTLYNASCRIIQELQPKYYCIENVRGAVPFFGRGYRSYGSFFLWGNFPDLAVNNSKFHFVKSHVTSGHKRRVAERGLIPRGLSQALLDAVSFHRFLFELPPIKFERSLSWARPK
ncbi:MAG: DNA cytosine methyltransferase [Chloroflexi bacterium]|nr:DNA cytosine methyltransferase [Chloroflexota bacterium]